MSTVLEVSQSEEKLSTDQAVWECFKSAAFGSTCLIGDLLHETRKTGLDDIAVLESISASETYDSIACRGPEKHYRTCCSAKGLFYVESDEFSGDYRLASIFEAFADQKKELDVAGVESIVLKAAQTVHKGFKTGAMVSVRIVKRVCWEYHTESIRGVKLQKVIDGLIERGICHQQGSKLGMVTDRQTELDAVCTLTPDPIEQQVLRAANDSIDWFKSRNVAPLKGVFSIVYLRLNLHPDEFQYAIARLVTSGILEQVQSKGTTGLRLTKEAEGQLN